MEKYDIMSYEKRGRADGLFSLGMYYYNQKEYNKMIKYSNITYKHSCDQQKIQIIKHYRECLLESSQKLSGTNNRL